MKNLLLIILSFLLAISNHSQANEEKICSPTDCYTIIQKLGEGAFGEVYEVENSSGLRFALKSYKTQENEWMASSLFADAKREFERGQLLDHPHIVKSIDLFTTSTTSEETRMNLLLEFVEGQNLWESSKKRLTGDQALNASLDLIDALRYALSLGFVHLDLHQGNLMLDQNSKIVVIDLASFFSFDELFAFVASESKEIKDKTLATQIPPKEPQGAQKMRKFFDQNPKIFAEFKHLQDDRKQALAKNPLRLHIASKQAMDPLISDAPPSYRSMYSDRITEICSELISRSYLNRDEKIDLRVDLKKLSWNYQEDVEEGQCNSLQSHLEQLFNILETHRHPKR